MEKDDIDIATINKQLEESLRKAKEINEALQNKYREMERLGHARSMATGARNSAYPSSIVPQQPHPRYDSALEPYPPAAPLPGSAFAPASAAPVVQAAVQAVPQQVPVQEDAYKPAPVAPSVWQSLSSMLKSQPQKYISPGSGVEGSEPTTAQLVLQNHISEEYVFPISEFAKQYLKHIRSYPNVPIPDYLTSKVNDLYSLALHNWGGVLSNLFNSSGQTENDKMLAIVAIGNYILNNNNRYKFGDVDINSIFSNYVALRDLPRKMITRSELILKHKDYAQSHPDINEEQQTVDISALPCHTRWAIFGTCSTRTKNDSIERDENNPSRCARETRLDSFWKCSLNPKYSIMLVSKLVKWAIKYGTLPVVEFPVVPFKIIYSEWKERGIKRDQSEAKSYREFFRFKNGHPYLRYKLSEYQKPNQGNFHTINWLEPNFIVGAPTYDASTIWNQKWLYFLLYHLQVYYIENLFDVPGDKKNWNPIPLSASEQAEVKLIIKLESGISEEGFALSIKKLIAFMQQTIAYRGRIVVASYDNISFLSRWVHDAKLIASSSSYIDNAVLDAVKKDTLPSPEMIK